MPIFLLCVFPVKLNFIIPKTPEQLVCRRRFSKWCEMSGHFKIHLKKGRIFIIPGHPKNLWSLFNLAHVCSQLPRGIRQICVQARLLGSLPAGIRADSQKCKQGDFNHTGPNHGIRCPDGHSRQIQKPEVRNCVENARLNARSAGGQDAAKPCTQRPRRRHGNDHRSNTEYQRWRQGWHSGPASAERNSVKLTEARTESSPVAF